MNSHTFTYVACVCGHRGAIVETYDLMLNESWRHVWLRDLSGGGTYEGSDSLFEETKPVCPNCGRSLTPENAIGRSEMNEAAELYPHGLRNP